MVPFGIGGEWYHSVGYIISPVTMKQWEYNKHLERANFVDLICESDEFLNLIEHVYLHQIEEHYAFIKMLGLLEFEKIQKQYHVW